MRSICESGQCTGCSACIDSCGRNAISLVDTYDTINAYIDETKCVRCNRCIGVCPVINPVIKNEGIQWWQGWSNDERLRRSSSSGGIASSLSQYFIDDGGYVASCCYEGNKFVYRIAKSKEELEGFAGSKYVKSDPSGMYKKVKELLQAQKKILFIGLPCHVAGMRNYVGDCENLVLVDLICHGTPSIKTFHKFVEQNEKNVNRNKKWLFRENGRFGINFDSNIGITDAFMLSFLYCLNYTENCYSCKYTGIKRCSDITLGDSWGSDLTDEIKSGISLIICSTQRGTTLIKKCNLTLKEVDKDNAVLNNAQLRKPSSKPVSYALFFKSIKADKNYCSTVFKILPKQSIKQLIKGCLIRLKMYPKMYEKNN